MTTEERNMGRYIEISLDQASSCLEIIGFDEVDAKDGSRSFCKSWAEFDQDKDESTRKPLEYK